MGESSAGGSVLLHVAADGPKPFTQAIPQSPGIISQFYQAEGIFDDFMGFLNVKNLDEARQLDSKAVIEGNFAHIGAAPTTTYIYGPIADGKYVKEAGLSFLKSGSFDKSINILAGHNVFEGAFFFDPRIETDEEFAKWVHRSFPGLGEENVNDLLENIYPPVYDGSLNYNDISTRGMRLWSEAVVDCSWHLVSEATRNVSYSCKKPRHSLPLLERTRLT